MVFLENLKKETFLLCVKLTFKKLSRTRFECRILYSFEWSSRMLDIQISSCEKNQKTRFCLWKLSLLGIITSPFTIPLTLTLENSFAYSFVENLTDILFKKSLAESNENWRSYCENIKYLVNLAHPIHSLKVSAL